MVQYVGGDDEVEQAVSGDSPIPRTHAVLSDAHWHWHQALSAYPDPPAFRASVNALIQALRNVTWVLQSEKHGIRNFDSWYAEWQARLKADPILRWLVDTRNATVKRGELKTRSKARVALTFDWAGERAVRHLDVPALMRTEDIPNAVRVHVPEAVRDTAFIRIDRRWVADTLPDWELLDALGHCYGMVASVASDAHAKANREVETTHPHEALRPRGDDGRLACMVATEDQRTVVLNLATHATLQPAITRLEVDDAAVQLAAKKYRVESPTEVTDDPLCLRSNALSRLRRYSQKTGTTFRLSGCSTQEASRWSAFRQRTSNRSSSAGNALAMRFAAWGRPHCYQSLKRG